ncbi:MAG: Fic/DOC family N-terminal domain-containing protein [Candidatus Margulisiibacteriota bacterium]
MKEPFVPQSLPLQSLNWVEFINLIGRANAELARYDGILQGIINPSVMLSPLTTKEAVVSSKIEGTQASLEEVLAFEAAPDKNNEKFNDIKEILNYRNAMKFAVNWLDSKPITLNLVKHIHEILLDSVRGRDKGRGRFRVVQNWIGTPGAKMEEATYVPPSPMFLMEYLSNFEKYIHFDEKDPLVQLAILHAQFEIIHPFLDGNGRLGRILIPLFLFEKKILNLPMFYISEYLEAHREEYYARLNDVTKGSQWEKWIEFFLGAIINQAKVNCQKAKGILGLYEQKKEKLAEVTHSQYVIRVLDTLFAGPIFSSTSFVQRSKIPRRSALRLLKQLKDEKIVFTLYPSSGRRPEMLVFKKLMGIVG